MYKKIPEFQTLRTRLYAVFTGKIIQREPCAGGSRPRGSPHRTPSPKGAPQSGTQTRRPEVRTTRADTLREHQPMPHAPPCPAATPVHGQHRSRPQEDVGFRFPAAPRPPSRPTPNPSCKPAASTDGPYIRHQRKKASPGPRNADISPNTPPDANRAPRAGPPRGCAPWRRGARGQGSSR